MRAHVGLATVGCILGCFLAVAAQDVGRVYKTSEGVTAPKLIKEGKPQYTAQAMRERIQGRVIMDVVVLANGNVGDVKIARSLDKKHGLDEQAIKAVKQWKFVPGTKDGKPVAVQVQVEMTFTLKL
jgi:protein TonB